MNEAHADRIARLSDLANASQSDPADRRSSAAFAEVEGEIPRPRS